MCEHAGHTQRLANPARDRDTRAPHLPFLCFTTEAQSAALQGGDVGR